MSDKSLTFFVGNIYEPTALESSRTGLSFSHNIERTWSDYMKMATKDKAGEERMLTSIFDHGMCSLL